LVLGNVSVAWAKKVARSCPSQHTQVHRRRTLSLPPAAKDETVAATYDNGILEVRVRWVETAPINRTVPVRERR
jgi:HSP20 family molecular chaperone IbpA